MFFRSPFISHLFSRRHVFNLNIIETLTSKDEYQLPFLLQTIFSYILFFFSVIFFLTSSRKKLFILIFFLQTALTHTHTRSIFFQVFIYILYLLHTFHYPLVAIVVFIIIIITLVIIIVVYSTSTICEFCFVSALYTAAVRSQNLSTAHKLQFQHGHVLRLQYPAYN